MFNFEQDYYFVNEDMSCVTKIRYIGKKRHLGMDNYPFNVVGEKREVFFTYRKIVAFVSDNPLEAIEKAGIRLNILNTRLASLKASYEEKTLSLQ